MPPPQQHTGQEMPDQQMPDQPGSDPKKTTCNGILDDNDIREMPIIEALRAHIISQAREILQYSNKSFKYHTLDVVTSYDDENKRHYVHLIGYTGSFPYTWHHVRHDHIAAEGGGLIHVLACYARTLQTRINMIAKEWSKHDTRESNLGERVP